MSKSNGLNIVFVSVTLIMLSVLFQNAISSAMYIWSVSEIFNHCFLILPVAIYLIYRKREALLSKEIRPAYIMLLPLSAILCLAIFADIGDINVFSHIALFTFIPATIITFIGFRAARVIAFPLAYILLAIPIGEELIPTLQSITADMSVFLLKLVQIPIYRSGLYIDIPGGKFLVAEACSGISFLISSIAFGSLYAHLNFNSTKAKIGFIILSILVPIFANAIRVFGIISIAYNTNMEYAVGADHLIYGWVFYLFVLFCLFYLGERLSAGYVPDATQYNNHASWQQYSALKPALSVSALMVIALSWTLTVSQEAETDQTLTLAPEHSWKATQANPLGTTFSQPDLVTTAYLHVKGKPIHFNLGVYYPNSKGETISSKSKVFDRKKWSQQGTREYTSIRVNNTEVSLPITTFVSPYGRKFAVIHFYKIGDFVTASSVKAKLFQTYQTMLNKQRLSVNAVVAIELNKYNTLENINELFSQIPTDFFVGVDK